MAGKTIGIIIARMSSSRLPGKVLRPLGQRPLLDFTLERMQAVPELQEIWLATSAQPEDEALVAWAKGHGLPVMAYDGDINDVVGRISAVLEAAKPERFVTVLGDTPFVDHRLLGNLFTALDQHPEWDTVVVDHNEKVSVHGGILCYRTSAWQKIDEASNQPMYREHAGSILRDKPHLLTQGAIVDEPLYYTGPYRLTVDTSADLELARHLVEKLYHPEQLLTLAEILTYLQEHPTVTEMNQHVRQKNHNEASQRLLITVQAGGSFGLGHLSRCKTIGKALKEAFSSDVTFWLDTPLTTLRDTLVEDGWKVSIEQSLSETLQKGAYDRLLIDFQESLSRELMAELKQAWPQGVIAVLDNNGPGCREADTVIFPNVHAVPDPSWSHGHPQVYSGPEYVLLGANFLADVPEAPEPTDQPHFVLVTMGGVDPNHLTERVLKSLCLLEDCHIDLVVPPMYPTPEAIEVMATELPSTITLHWKLAHIRPLMQRATLAIAAFGITAYELANMGVPTLLVGHDASQVEDMKRFAEFGSAINMGEGGTVHPKKLYETLRELLRQPERLAEMAKNGRTLVPHEDGAIHVARCLLNASPLNLKASY